MLTLVERVLILQSADLLHDVGPRHLLRLAEVATEIELTSGETVYRKTRRRTRSIWWSRVACV
jgi:hypothetical protein